MADVVLSDGKEITFDWSKVKRKECIKFFTDQMTVAEESEFFEHLCGMTLDEINDLSVADVKYLLWTLRNEFYKPYSVTEKNSVSASTLPE